MMKLRYPVITVPKKSGADFSLPVQPLEPIVQLQSYLHQLVDELNYALEDVETQASEAKTLVTKSTSSGAATEKESQASFNSIKSLIIKSADIVNAYYEVINKRLEGLYVAQSDFGTYTEATALEIEANSEAIAQYYSDMQQILTDIGNLEHSLIEVNAHIKSGLLDYADDGTPVYGLEVGQRTEKDGVEVFNKYARFTASRLSFFDQNGKEVAWISDRQLYITHVEVTGTYTIGGFVDTVLGDKSVVTKWVSGGDE